MPELILPRREVQGADAYNLWIAMKTLPNTMENKIATGQDPQWDLVLPTRIDRPGADKVSSGGQGCVRTCPVKKSTHLIRNTAAGVLIFHQYFMFAISDLHQLPTGPFFHSVKNA